MALKPNSGHRTPLIVGTALLTLAIDQITKIWAVEVLPGRTIDIFWTLRFKLTHNTGFAFSSGAGLGPFLALLVPVIVVIMWRYRRRISGTLAPIALGCLLGGAVGNLVDRLLRGRRWGRGGVVDFIDLQFWPIFNVADAAIVVGVIIVTWHLYRHSSETVS